MSTPRRGGLHHVVHVPDTTGWGLVLAAIAAVISGVSIWLNAFAVKEAPDPAVFTTLKNAVAAAVLCAVAGLTVRPADFQAVRGRSWLALGAIGVIGGGLAFLLFFTGLAAASAPSAAFIQKTLFVWVGLLAVPILGERLGLAQLLAVVVLIAGQALVLPPNGIVWGSGETMILAATGLWTVEVLVARRFLRGMPAAAIGAGRLGIGLIVLVGFVIADGRSAAIAALRPDGWGWILVTGLCLAAYVGTWFAALRRAPASSVTSVLVGGAVITGLLQAASKGTPSPSIAAGYVLIAVAVAASAVLGARTGRGLHRDPELASAVVAR
jgi:drug/metabolite transporter (DMT)-like permease